MAYAYINIIHFYICLNRCRSILALCVYMYMHNMWACLSKCDSSSPLSHTRFDFSSIFASSFFIYRNNRHPSSLPYRNSRTDHHHHHHHDAQLKFRIDGFPSFPFPLAFSSLVSFSFSSLVRRFLHIFINSAFKIVCVFLFHSIYVYLS